MSFLRTKCSEMNTTLGAESFAGRKFRERKKSRNQGHKLSRMTFLRANFASKTFAIEKKDAFSREKTFTTEEK